MSRYLLTAALSVASLMFFSVLNSCGERESIPEKEMSDLKKIAYDINYQFVNEASTVSSFAKKMTSSNLESGVIINRTNNSSGLYSVMSFPESYKSVELPAKVDSSILKNRKDLKLATRLIFGCGSDYYIYPKMNTKFQNLEERDFHYPLSTSTDSLIQDLHPRWLPVSFDPLEKQWVVRYLHVADTARNIFAVAHFQIQKVFDEYLNSASGSFILVNDIGDILAMSDDAYFVTGYTKTQQLLFSGAQSKIGSMIALPTIYNSANESFRNRVFEMIQSDKKQTTFKYSGEEFTMIRSSIKQLKWQLIRIL